MRLRKLNEGKNMSRDTYFNKVLDRACGTTDGVSDSLDALVRCDSCQHYRHTPDTERVITIGLGSMTVGHPEKHECAFMPELISVKPDHSCGQYTPNDGISFEKGD